MKKGDDLALREEVLKGHLLRCIDSGWAFVHGKGHAEQVFRNVRDKLDEVVRIKDVSSRKLQMKSMLKELVDAGSPHVNVLFASNNAKKIFADARQAVEMEAPGMLKKGDVVTFSEVKDKGDENAVMVLEENPDGGRVLVRHLVDMNLQPTSVYPVSDLKLVFGVSSEDVFLAVSRMGADITMADADKLFLALDAQDRIKVARFALNAGVDMGEQTLAAQQAIATILFDRKLLTNQDGKTVVVQVHASITVPTLEESIERMKREVIADVRSGKVPATVKSFSELHDYVDANEYGGFCEDGVLDVMTRHFGGRDENEGMPDEMMEYLNGAQNAIDAWIKSGGVSMALQQGNHQLRVDGPCSSGAMP